MPVTGGLMGFGRMEATGRDRSRADFQRHLEAGARRVGLCVPPREKPDILAARLGGMSG